LTLGLFEGDLNFFERVMNTILSVIAPVIIIPRLIYNGVQQVTTQYQIEHGLPLENIYELRSRASFALINAGGCHD
jgi:hypothetical protein